jgi:hypothetical protein
MSADEDLPILQTQLLPEGVVEHHLAFFIEVGSVVVEVPDDHAIVRMFPAAHDERARVPSSRAR